MKPNLVWLVIFTQIASLDACNSFRGVATPLRAPLTTDSTEVIVLFRGNAYVANIGFTFRNTTGRIISRVGCGGPGVPDLEKKVNGRWVPAYYAAVLACRISPDHFWNPGWSTHEVLRFMAFEPGHNIMPELKVDSIDGVYRLHWDFREGRDASARRARRVEATSNEFHMTLRSAPAFNTR